MLITPRHAVFSFMLMATGASQAAGLAACTDITDDGERLACYDRASGRQAPPAAPAAPAAANPSTEAAPGAAGGSFLSQHWELDEADKHGTFRFRAHHDNYLLLANLNSAPNGAPFRPTNPLSSRSAVGPDHVELAFQLGFKTKLVEHAAGSRGDLWFGYTQQSYWQAYNTAASRPFRETNYQPELMAVLPLDLALGGLRAWYTSPTASPAHSRAAGTGCMRNWARSAGRWRSARGCGGGSMAAARMTIIQTSSTTWAMATSARAGAMRAMNFRLPRAATSALAMARCRRAGHFRWRRG